MSLTLLEARARATLLHSVEYDVTLDVTDREWFTVATTVRFACREPGATTFLEFAAGEALKVDGAEASYDGVRITLRDLAEVNEVRVEARARYVTDGEGFHTFTDPADGESYVGAYCGMDLAQRVFPCFDQNDLKAPITLTVLAPDGWRVLANGLVTHQDGGRWEFAATAAIPPALFIAAAGPWASYTWEHGGLPFGWHARASLAFQLERDAAELRRISEACFDHYAGLFTEPYPFDSCDQVFVPGLNWGAMENPGCISYRDELLPLDPPTEPEARDRAMTIAHEMAHMWFGDLVTMTWWEDTWLQESFADYLGFRVAEEAAGFAGTFVDFTIGWKPQAYLADERRSTHPVAPRPDDVPDVAAADGNFDALSYAKGNSVLRQLCTVLGDDVFFAGVNAYLSRHAWGNATLADFVAALDSVADVDVAGWVADWLQTTGFDTLRVRPDGDGLVLVREGSRSHRVRVTSYDERLGEVGSHFVDIGDDPVPLPGAVVVLPNAGGETYARLRLDQRSWTALTDGLTLGSLDASARAIVWTTAFDLADCGEMTADDVLLLVTRHLPHESHPSIVHGVVSWCESTLLPRLVPPGQAATAVATIAAACESALAVEPAPAVAATLTRALAATSPDSTLLRRWLANGRTDTDLEVDPTLRWLAIHRLAALGSVDQAEIERERVADATINGVLGAATATAALPTAEAKRVAWALMFDDPAVSNRMFRALATGVWNVEQVALLEPWISRYVTDVSALAIQRGPGFQSLAGQVFPRIPLNRAHLRAFDEALKGELPTILRRAWEDNVDDARRVLADQA